MKGSLYGHLICHCQEVLLFSTSQALPLNFIFLLLVRVSPTRKGRIFSWFISLSWTGPAYWFKFG